MSAKPLRPSRPRRAVTRNLRSRRLGLVMAAAFIVTSLGFLATPGTVAAWDPDEVSATSEELLAALTNQSRASAALRTLTVDPVLVEVARWRSTDMAERDYFSHEIPPTGTKVFDELAARGYCFEGAGENIGWLGGSDVGAERRIQQMFIDSPSHRSVLMGEDWDVIGIGAYKRASDGRHYWTVLFANACGDATPAALTAGGPPARLGPAGLRVEPAVPAGGILESVMGGIAGFFFGG